MPIDLKALQKQRAMIDEIIRIASDPEAARLLEQIVVGGKKTEPEVPAMKTQEPKAPLLFPSERQPIEAERGTQVTAIRKAVAGQAGDFTVEDIGSGLRAGGMDIDNIAIGKVLRRLASKGELRVTLQGSGSSPNRYEKTERFRSAA